MSLRKCGGIGKLGTGAFAALALGAALSQPALAQTRTLTILADVPVLVPAPYHPHVATAVYSAMLYDGYPYYGGLYRGGGARYWH